MTKFSCTMSSGAVMYYTTLVAENAQQAKEMAVAETNKTSFGAGGEPRDWSARALEETEGPARILTSGQRDA